MRERIGNFLTNGVVLGILFIAIMNIGVTVADGRAKEAPDKNFSIDAMIQTDTLLMGVHNHVQIGSFAMEDGTRCITVHTNNSVAISCDWANKFFGGVSVNSISETANIPAIPILETLDIPVVE